MSRTGAACALALLLVAAAGAAAPDAHAQSNTQRLATIESVAAGVSNVVDAIRDALDGAAAGLADALAAIAGVRDSADSVLASADSTGSNLAELRDEIRSLQTEMSGASAAASSLAAAAASGGAAAAAAAGSVSALDAGVSDVSAGVSSLNGSVSNVRGGVASLGAGAAALGAAAESLAGSVSALDAGVSTAHNLTGVLDAGADRLAASLGNGTSNDAHTKMDMIYGELVRHGEAPPDVDGSAAGAIAAANVRLDSLEAALQRVEGSLLAMDANIRNVETAAANGTFGRGQPGSGGLMTVVTAFTVDTSHYAKAAGAKPADNIYRYGVDFACGSDVFVQRVEAETIRINNGTGTATGVTTSTGGGTPLPQCRYSVERNFYFPPAPPNCSMPTRCENRDGSVVDCPTGVQLPRKYDANPFGPDALRFAERSTITVQGRPVIDTMFTPAANANPIRFHQPAAFDLLKLSPGSALRIDSVMNATILTQQAAAFAGAPGRNYSFFDHAALTGSNGTLTDRIKLDLYKIKVTSLASGDPACRLGGGGSAGGGTYGPEQSALLAVMGEGNLVRTFRTALDCNDQPARITSNDKVRFSFGGTVGADLVNLASLTLRAGGSTMEFAFDADARPVPKAGTASSLAWNGGDLELSGTIPLVQGAVIQVTYQTAPGNSCTEVR